MSLPYLPLYLAHLGYPGWQIGLVVGLHPLLRWTSAIAWSWVADRWGIRERLLVVLGLAGGAGYLLLPFVERFAAVALVLAAIGLLHGPLIPMLDATVLDNLRRLGGDYGRLRLWGSASFILGSAGSAPLVAAFSPRIVPLLLVLANLGLVLPLLGLPRTPVGSARFESPWRLLDRALVALLATVFLVDVSGGAWTGFFALHTTALGLPASTPGVAWGLAALAEIAVFRWGAPVLARVSAARLLVWVTVFTSVRWALVAAAEREVAVVGLQLGHAITFSASHLAVQGLLAQLVPARSTTGGQALYGLARFGVGAAVGLWLAGAVVDRIGTRALFGVEAAIALAALVPALVARRALASALRRRPRP